MAPMRKVSQQPDLFPTSTKANPRSSTHNGTKQSQLTIPKRRPLPRFLSQPAAVLEAKYAQITTHECTHLITRPNAWHSHPVSHTRDRYSKIKPWNWNAISLSALGQSQSQSQSHPYINASPIILGPSSPSSKRRQPREGRGERRRESFIATQGPLGEDESADGPALFWQMVWQEGSQVIVMLTGVVEEGKVKCGVYFPEQAEETKHIEGFGSVECVSKILCAGTEVRELRVVRRTGDGQEQEQEHRTVWHLWLPTWPDNEVPAGASGTTELLELIKMSRFLIDERVPPRKQETLAPRIVHCSGGIGRTGTFIALDQLIQELRRGDWEDMEDDDDDEGEDDEEADDEPHEDDEQATSDGSISSRHTTDLSFGETEQSNSSSSSNSNSNGGFQRDAQPRRRGEITGDPVWEVVMSMREQRTRMVAQPVQYLFIYEVLRKVWAARYHGAPRRDPSSSSSPTRHRLGAGEEDLAAPLSAFPVVKRRRLSPPRGTHVAAAS